MSEKARGTTADDLLVHGTFALRRAISRLADLPVAARPEGDRAATPRPPTEPVPEQAPAAPVVAGRS
jgi:hypothetical protein